MAEKKKSATTKKTTRKTENDEPKKVRTVRHEVVIALPSVKVPKILKPFQGFVNFVREQGVVGLAIGLVLGVQIKALVDSFVASFVNPLLGLLLPGTGDLAAKEFIVRFNGKKAEFGWGAFVSQLISFITVAAIVYFTVKMLKLDKLDKKKA